MDSNFMDSELFSIFVYFVLRPIVFLSLPVSAWFMYWLIMNPYKEERAELWNDMMPYAVPSFLLSGFFLIANVYGLYYEQ